ncbi:hypothetical protein FE840_014410 [Peteryoungia desertarenae]|uniref:Type II toxin-antitoxin system ParD family antitoxin n=1 Tax=Peteryoungia desertarenae TaxID=1813451 RepID=A0ABX6QR10_9HYPH|nr:hypothetical protein [Peteryoungia desertarenae]QLF70635.1 hypothetical protein FE840_014410 [Peteryoungia desertarenae]
MTTIIVNLDAEALQVVEGAIASGEFGSAQEVILAALGDWQINRLLNGVAKEEPDPVPEAVLELGDPVDGEAGFGEIDLESYLASRKR